jgi:hypothetical protein
MLVRSCLAAAANRAESQKNAHNRAPVTACGSFSPCAASGIPTAGRRHPRWRCRRGGTFTGASI